MTHQGCPHREGKPAFGPVFVHLAAVVEEVSSMPRRHHLGRDLGRGPGKSLLTFVVVLRSSVGGSWLLGVAGSKSQCWRCESSWLSVCTVAAYVAEGFSEPQRRAAICSASWTRLKCTFLKMLLSRQSNAKNDDEKSIPCLQAVGEQWKQLDSRITYWVKTNRKSLNRLNHHHTRTVYTALPSEEKHLNFESQYPDKFKLVICQRFLTLILWNRFCTNVLLI